MNQPCNEMSRSDTFKEITQNKTSEIKIKGSRFIGESILVRTEADIDHALKRVRKREYNATHHCWAYRLGVWGEVSRFNDDGEPSGSAGMPILRQIEAIDITNVLVVVTRFYGGTKLGTGGLARAYGDAGRDVLAKTTIKEQVLRDNWVVSFAYDDTSGAMHTINSFDIEISGSEYGNDTKLYLAVRRSECEAFVQQFTEKLRGRGRIESGGVGAP